MCAFLPIKQHFLLKFKIKTKNVTSSEKNYKYCLVCVSFLKPLKAIDTFIQTHTSAASSNHITCWNAVSSLHNGRVVSEYTALMISLFCTLFSWMLGTWSSSWLAVRPCFQKTHQCGSKTWQDTSTSNWLHQRPSPQWAAMLTVSRTQT